MRENKQTLKSDKEKQKLRLGEFSVHNFPHIGSPYALIPLTQGKFAVVDAEDYEYLNQWKWSTCKIKTQTGNLFYAYRQHKGHTIYMHREILGLKNGDGKHTDHINHNGLNNRKCNLRICIARQNNQNRRPQGKTSKFKGVCWNKMLQKWYTQICYNQNRIPLGFFDNEIDAAKTYDKKAKELFGKFANCNF